MRCSRHPFPRTALACALLATAATAQQVVLRGKIAKFARSACGATHITVCSRIELRSVQVNLAAFTGKPVEIRGKRSGGKCPRVDVNAIRVLGVDQFTKTAVGGASMAVFFHGAPAGGTRFALFVGALAKNPLFVPPISGPFHLDPAILGFVGIFKPFRATSPYLSLRLPNLARFKGITFFDQAIVLHPNGKLETTNLDCFRF